VSVVFVVYQIFTPLLSEYLSRLSMIVDNKLNCGPVLTWMEVRLSIFRKHTSVDCVVQWLQLLTPAHIYARVSMGSNLAHCLLILPPPSFTR
jgi:hypothetical protein